MNDCQSYLEDEGLAEEGDGKIRYRRQLLAYLQKRELKSIAAKIAAETGLDYKAAKNGTAIEGTYRKRLNLASGRYALIEGSKEFTLVPWRPVLERAKGAGVSGMMRGDKVSWNIGRGRNVGIF